jgi:hypothetical protein
VLNRRAGVFLDYSATGNLIGGTAPGAGNVISGNERGIYIFDGYSNTIQGNLIGPNAAGTAIIGQPEGIFITEFSGPANHNLIGGTDPRARNVIAGNGTGIVIAASGNMVQGNLIGVLADGVTPAGNSTAGIDLPGIHSHDNLIGGSAAGAGNVIAFSTGVPGYASASGAGVRIDGIQGYNPVRNAILGNSIFANAGLGIDLTNDPEAPGVTFNDPGDSDAGANNLQNFPVLASAIIAGSTTVEGSLNSTPSTTFRVEFFSSQSADPSGYGEGARFLGAISVTTNAAGNATFTGTFATAVQPGQMITATATDSANNTSEFSRAITAQAGGADTAEAADSLPMSPISSPPMVAAAPFTRDPSLEALIAGQKRDAVAAFVPATPMQSVFGAADDARGDDNIHSGWFSTAFDWSDSQLGFWPYFDWNNEGSDIVDFGPLAFGF